jgi:hypothetical protein
MIPFSSVTSPKFYMGLSDSNGYLDKEAGYIETNSETANNIQCDLESATSTFNTA